MCRHGKYITETNRMHSVLFGMQNRTLRPYLTAMDRILISVMKNSNATSTEARTNGNVLILCLSVLRQASASGILVEKCVSGT
jgi:hypothetical protein